MDPSHQFRYILEAMHIGEPQYDQMASREAKKALPPAGPRPLTERNF
jgi:hypothetical protein